MRLFAVVLLCAGCASGVKVTRWAGPPKYNAGAPGPIVLEVTGTDSAVAMMRPYLRTALEKNLQFEVVTERSPGVPVLACDVQRWTETRPAVQTSQPGVVTTDSIEHLTADLVLTRADGEVIRTRYTTSQADFARQRVERNDTLALNNVHDVVKRLVIDFTPVRAPHLLAWDDDTSAADGLAHARAGDFAAAEVAWRKESTAAAHYNLGVLYESRGDSASALAEYALAATLSEDPRYARARDEMKQSAEFATRR